MSDKELINIFDDLVYESNKCWTQVCQECIHKYSLGVWDEIPIEKLICGVKDCTNEASNYLDIEIKE
mgnify:CR=1 FL=1